MSTLLICAAHSPLMSHLTPDAAVSGPILDALHGLSRQVAAFDPELVVLFGPDHFAGFFYDLMPPFCIGARAAAIGDFGIAQAGQSLNVPEDIASAMVASLHAADVDVSVSYRLHADHGFAQALETIAGGVGRYPTIPVFINCAAPPLSPMARVRRLGEGIGRFLATVDRRVLLIGSGGLSHDPPIPMLRTASPAMQEILIAGRDASHERMQGKLQRNVDTARELAAGAGSALPLDPAWDLAFMDLLSSGDLDAAARLDLDAARAVAGVGVHEVRTWMAAFAAFEAMGHRGPHECSLRHYTAVPLWNAGFGIVAVNGASPGGIAEIGDVAVATEREAAWTSA